MTHGMSRDLTKPQSVCFQGTDGWKFMCTFDKLPEDIRRRVRNSPFNLCAACLQIYTYHYGGDFMQAIDYMEARIREGT